MLIDIHSHIGYDWRSDRYQVEALLADSARHDIDRRVVSVLAGDTRTSRGNDLASKLAVRYPDRFIGCAMLNPKQTDAVAETERVLNLPGIRMVEFNSFDHGYYPDVAPRLPAMLDLLEGAGVPVKVFTGIGPHSMPHQWVRHAQAHPNLQFIFLHCGCFDYGYGCVDLAVENPNVSVETSNQYEVQILRALFDRVPVERIYWGTTFPERFTSSGLGVLEGVELGDADLALIRGGNAQRLLRLEDVR